MVKELIHQFIN